MKKLIPFLLAMLIGGSAVGIGLVLAWPGGATPDPVPLKFFRFQAGDQTFALRPSYVNNYVMTADSSKSITVPDGANYAIFSATNDIWVEIDGTVAVPEIGDVTDGTGSELNPIIRRVSPGDTIGVISQYDTLLSVSFYK